jgi:leucine dehydrogenase
METILAPAPTEQVSPFAVIEKMNHEQVVLCHDADTGLKAIIAIHNTVLGPALGGTRFWHYANEADALTDVLRLSRGMTFKSSLAGLNLGGGKAVILGNPKKMKNEALLRRFGQFVNSLAGKYITAEDVGVDVNDMDIVRLETEHVVGLPEDKGGGGDPSPVTAYGVFLGIKAGLQFTTGSDSVGGKRVLVQGVGKVGYHLVELLKKDNAEVIVHDISEDNLRRVAHDFNVKVLTKDEVHSLYETECDIYAPCALGGTLNPTTIPQLKCFIVAGGANNQLLEEKRDGKALAERGILYLPDFLINAGGVINVYSELEGYNRERALRHCERIYNSALEVLTVARDHEQTTHQAALDLATKRIEAIGRINKYR